MSEMICITCPMGCHLHIERLSETEISVSGNRCHRGEAYAKEEILSPRRVVTATCAIATEGESPATSSASPKAASETVGAVFDAAQSQDLYRPRRVPVRTTAAFPKEKIPELLSRIYAVKLRLPVERGSVVLSDVLGTGIDVIVTRTM